MAHPNLTVTERAQPLSFVLTPTAPFRLDLTAWALRRQPSNRLDRWDGQTYKRCIQAGAVVFEAAVRQTRAGAQPLLEVKVAGPGPNEELEKAARVALGRLLGLKIDLGSFYTFAARKRELEPLVEEFRGVKPPRFPTSFETLANGIIFQQISLAAGTSVYNRLVETFGHGVDGSGCHAFPPLPGAGNVCRPGPFRHAHRLQCH